jgi:hypothetical protein
MSEATERIVGAYVKLRNRKVLEDMKVRRQRLITELKSAHGALDLGLSIKQLDDETTVRGGPYDAEYRSRPVI